MSNRAQWADAVPLVALGVAAGMLGALFGVGGGIVLVPTLVALGFAQRAASATSLAAIVVTAVAGTVTYGLQGDLDVKGAALVGAPAVAGVLAGTALQQRLRTDHLVYGFAAVLVAVGVKLLA